MKKSSRPQHNTAGRSLFFLFFNAETSVFLLCFVFRLRSVLPAQLRFIFSNLGNVLHGEAHSAHLVLAEADNGNLVAWDASLDYEITLRTNRSGIFGRLVESQLSGEGFVLRFSGSGRILVSSRNQGSFLDWVFSQRPRDKAEKENE